MSAYEVVVIGAGDFQPTITSGVLAARTILRQIAM